MLIGGFAVLAPVTYAAIALKWYYGQQARLGEYFDRVARSKLDTQGVALFYFWVFLLALAGILALIGLFLYESAIIKAGQDVPNA